jgi:hypothetical protein
VDRDNSLFAFKIKGKAKSVCEYLVVFIIKKKQSRYRPGVAQRVPGS